MLQEHLSDQKPWQQRYRTSLRLETMATNCVTGTSLATALQNNSQKGYHGTSVTNNSQPETMATVLLQNNPQAGKCNNVTDHYMQQCQN